MALTVADSDVLIDALRGREPARARVAEAIRTRRLATTVISVFELEGIGTADYLIAGICRTRSASLLTRNRRHFERVPELQLGKLGGPKSSD